MSTLCAGCGHDSVTAALVQAGWELELEPHRVGKMSGIGCSSKTTAYFMKQSHGFNSVHGRMPSVTSGAAAANRANSPTSASPATATRCRSAWASCRTRSVAT
jgi:2-oxoglutarate ferredoxin oxidoreductase subunit beta